MPASRPHFSQWSRESRRWVCACGNDLPCLTDQPALDAAEDAAAVLSLIDHSSVDPPTAPFPVIVSAAHLQLSSVDALVGQHTPVSARFCACWRELPCVVLEAANRARDRYSSMLALAGAGLMPSNPGRDHGEETPLISC